MIATIHLDIQKACDSVPHKKLFVELEKKQYSKELINTIKWLYAQTAIEVNGQLEHIRIGVIQGGILSPKLFNIFYDTLIRKLDNLKYFMIAYADDVTIAVIYKNQIKKVLKEVEQ